MTKDLIKLARHLDLIGEKTAANDLKRILLKNAAYRAASPKTVQDFNGFLAIILDQLQIQQSIVDMSGFTPEQKRQFDQELSNRGTIEGLKAAAKVPRRWNRATQAAWLEYARLAGMPEDQRENWEEYAKANGLVPTLGGMFDYMGSTMATVMPAAEAEAQERVKQDLQFALSDEGEEAYQEEQLANAKREAQEREMAEHKRVYDTFKGQTNRLRQEQMLESREGRNQVTNAIAAVEGLDPLDAIGITRRMTAMMDETEAGMQARWDETQKRMSREAGKAINALIKIADSLDRKGLRDEATAVDSVIKYLAN